MKTLDEVIRAIEECRDSYVAGKIIKSDAFLYLKMYRSDKIQWEADRKMWAEKGPEIEKKEDKLIKAAKDFLKAKAEMEEISADYVALKQWWTEQQENPPLTWDELKTMEGKPVWIEGCGFSHGFWVIIDYFSVGDEDFIALGGKCDEFWKQDMTDENNGTSWQAYRKERE